jgi:cysteine desulfurase/selenocysteine lyase
VLFIDIHPRIKLFRHNIIGIKQQVPTLSGKWVNYIYLDNAASTPALWPVVKRLEDFLLWYSGVHRGTGYKSLISSEIYDKSHEIIGEFFQADLDQNVVIVVKNTTEAINKLSYRLRLKPGDIVISTMMEHHSNDLPWRKKGKVKYARVDSNGVLDISDLEEKLKMYYPRVRLVTVCGASNVTGHINDIHKIAVLAHQYKAKILVDAAQLAPHSPIDMKPQNSPEHIDYLAFSGHKIYAPFGAGILIGPRDAFSGEPEFVGGGTVKMVSLSDVIWADLPDREEAGSPNVVGVFALAQTLKYLSEIGMDILFQHEKALTDYLMERLSQLPGITVYGTKPRVGVVSFNIKDLNHSLVGAILCSEAGIGVRTGCFCAQSYVRQLLGYSAFSVSPELYQGENRFQLPGMVRISLAGYNTYQEIDRLLAWLQKIINNKNRFKRDYLWCPRQDRYMPLRKPPGKIKLFEFK